MRQIKHIFLHCTGGPISQSVTSIESYWKNQLKWKNPGYHYLIDKYGVEHILSPESHPTNGVAGYNATSIHVCTIGGIDASGKFADTRNAAQKETLLKRIQDLHQRYPDAEILGHRDISPDTNKNGKVDYHEYIKFCPGYNAREEFLNSVK